MMTTFCSSTGILFHAASQCKSVINFKHFTSQKHKLDKEIRISLCHSISVIENQSNIQAPIKDFLVYTCFFTKESTSTKCIAHKWNMTTWSFHLSQKERKEA